MGNNSWKLPPGAAQLAASSQTESLLALSAVIASITWGRDFVTRCFWASSLMSLLSTSKREHSALRKRCSPDWKVLWGHWKCLWQPSCLSFELSHLRTCLEIWVRWTQAFRHLVSLCRVAMCNCNQEMAASAQRPNNSSLNTSGYHVLCLQNSRGR